MIPRISRRHHTNRGRDSRSNKVISKRRVDEESDTSNNSQLDDGGGDVTSPSSASSSPLSSPPSVGKDTGREAVTFREGKSSKRKSPTRKSSKLHLQKSKSTSDVQRPAFQVHVESPDRTVYKVSYGSTQQNQLPPVPASLPTVVRSHIRGERNGSRGEVAAAARYQKFPSTSSSSLLQRASSEPSGEAAAPAATVVTDGSRGDIPFFPRKVVTALPTTQPRRASEIVRAARQSFTQPSRQQSSDLGVKGGGSHPLPNDDVTKRLSDFIERRVVAAGQQESK